MPLYDVTNPKHKKISPKSLEKSPEIQVLIRDLRKDKFERLKKTIDGLLNNLIPSESSRLIWTKAAALVGHSSEGSKKWIDHFWEKIISVVGPDRLCLITAGTFIKWRISLRKETWLLNRRESDKWDDIDKKYIRISEYWINENYVLPDNNNKKKPASMESIRQLQEKWGGQDARTT